MTKKSNATSISVGGWWLDIHDLTLKHVNMGYYWVDAENLDEAELLDWVQHLSGKSHVLTAQDLRDFVKLARMVQLLDLKRLRVVLRTGNGAVMGALKLACRKMSHSHAQERKVRRLMKQRGIGPVVSIAVLGGLYEEVERSSTDA